MKKAVYVALPVLPLLFLSVNWIKSAPAQAPAARADNAFSFRIVFGETQGRAEDYSGSISLTQGKVVEITPWRFFGGDALEGSSGWKLNIKSHNFENQPDEPRPIATPGGFQNFVPAGVVVTVDAPMTATAHVRTAQGQLDIRLADVRYDRVLWLRDGDVSVQRVPFVAADLRTGGRPGLRGERLSIGHGNPQGRRYGRPGRLTRTWAITSTLATPPRRDGRRRSGSRTRRATCTRRPSRKTLRAWSG